MLELCGKEPSDVNKGLSLWRSRDGSRLSLIVTILRTPLWSSQSLLPTARMQAWLDGERVVVRSGDPEAGAISKVGR